MDKQLRDKWCLGLRSGEFEQGSGYLYLEDGNHYCCLGVLARQKGLSNDQLNGCAVMRKKIGGWIGDDRDGSKQATLEKMNDEGKSFSEIADWIEKNIEVRP